MKKFISAILAILVLSTLCGCEKGAEIHSEISETSRTETSAESAAATSETTVTTVETTTVTTTETEAASPYKSSEFYQYIQKWQGNFFHDTSEVSFCDLDLDGHYELLLRDSSIGRSFDTDCYRVYKLNNTEPQLYGYIYLESGRSQYTEHTALEGKLYRYYDKEHGVYIIVGDQTLWDDGSFGHIQYYINSNALYSDKIRTECIDEFSGTDCFPAEFIRNAPNSDLSGLYDFNCVYDGRMVDLNGTEKFLKMPDILQEYEFIDIIDPESLEKYKDIDKIMELVCEYSGYENINKVLSSDNESECIGIIGMSNREICTNDTEVYIEIKDIDELDWNKICKIEDLHSFALNYFGEDEIDLDLSPLKKYNNLTSISLWGNISKNTKRQISEFPNLEYVDMWDIVISSEEDFEYVRNLPKLIYIAVASDNDDPYYFKFLYDNKSIKWIRFDTSVTDEQIKRTIDNMPNIEAVTFGFSEV